MIPAVWPCSRQRVPKMFSTPLPSRPERRAGDADDGVAARRSFSKVSRVGPTAKTVHDISTSGPITNADSYGSIFVAGPNRARREILRNRRATPRRLLAVFAKKPTANAGPAE